MKKATEAGFLHRMSRALPGGVLLTGLLFCVAVPRADAVPLVEAGANVETAWNSGNYQSGTSTAFATYTQGDSTAWASADAASGTLRAYGLASPIHNAWDANAGADITASYTVHGTAPGATERITAYLTVDGNVSVPAPGAYDPRGGNPSAYVGARINTSPFTSDNFEDLCESGNCSSHSVYRRLSLTIDAVEGVPFDIHTGIGLWAFYGGVADFGSTASLSFDLPTGTWITSDGGYTQTAQSTTNAVPEPSTLFLLGSGLTGLVIARRKMSRG